MIIHEKSIDISVPSEIFIKYNLNNIAFFDIETTGFSKEEDKIILISLGKYLENDIYSIKQYFAENIEDEKNILLEFGKDIARFDKWCSFNGIAFDEPFIKNKLYKNKLEVNLPEEHIDLYRRIRPYHKQLGLQRCNLKSVEKYLGIKRKDTIDGGLSVILYNEYIRTRDEEIKEKILLHNYEDVLYLPKIFHLIYKMDNKSDLTIENPLTDKQEKYLIFLLKKNNINIEVDLNKISKRAACRLIDSIIKGERDSNSLKEIINNSY
ncbi:ribonuclease H-like domain-containing protein [Clostridium malenominatum]|uniref:Ribonuclease H-like domain-containing protein n=1 Tax=Clostridium malenominatum TaxID=1539 RepID=A0ABN1IV68_9CLOT